MGWILERIYTVFLGRIFTNHIMNIHFLIILHPSVGGFINGIYIFIVGILLIYLSRHQVYVLTSLFILVFFELFCCLGSGILFTIMLTELRGCDYFSICREGSWRIILIVHLINNVIMFFFAVVTLSIIANGRRPQAVSTFPQTIIYARQSEAIPITVSNPSTMVVQ